MRELHCTDETKCGETLPGDLEPIGDPFTIASEITLRKSNRFSYGESPRTLSWRELHSTGEIMAWRDPGGS